MVMIMAKKTTVSLIDDLDGTELPEGTKSTTFSLHGIEYTIDLSEKNISKIEKALDPFITAGTKTTGTRRRSSGSGSGSTTSKEKLAAIRAWAAEKNIELPPRGRIKSEIVEQFDAEQG